MIDMDQKKSKGLTDKQSDLIELPLVSIVVITYNSEEFVAETLDSIQALDYPRIELIIADDCSSDATVSRCKEWLAVQADHFEITRLIASSINTGTSANCNRGLHQAKGTWIKFIAGDDILDPQFFMGMKDLLIAKDIHVVAGQIFKFSNNIKEASQSWPNFEFPKNYSIQRRRQVVKGLLLAPSVVLRKSTLDSLGGFDQRYRILEDDPMWFKLTLAGYAFHYSAQSKVFYRQHAASVNSIEARQLYYRKPVFLNDLINFGKEVRFPVLIKEKLYAHALLFYAGLIFEQIIYKNGSKLDSWINRTSKKFVLAFNKVYNALPY